MYILNETELITNPYECDKSIEKTLEIKLEHVMTCVGDHVDSLFIGRRWERDPPLFQNWLEAPQR